MRIKLSSNLFSGPEFPHVEFIAETDFEKDFLHRWAKRDLDFKFEYYYPNEEPKDLNNPLVTLVITKKNLKQ